MKIHKITKKIPQYGEISAHAVSVNLTSVNQNDWDQILAFNTNGESSNLIVPDHTNDHITENKAGVYEISFNWSGFGPASPHDWDIHVAKNNRGTTFTNFTGHFRTPTAQNLQTVTGCSGKVSLSIEDTIELWIQRLSAGSNIILTTTACTLGLIRIN
ncbi:hypothetical protein KAR91_04080 [Candidatus Pacearchaeota archaeon]|nr:hypothetical protein [Candidatus Pacearchaeota archaeon]